MVFEVLPNGTKASIGYQFVLFDIKLEVFRCKARLVAGGYITEAPATIMYAGIVSRKTVRIALMIAILNDLEVSQVTS